MVQGTEILGITKTWLYVHGCDAKELFLVEDAGWGGKAASEMGNA